jgi:hypothetical protein
MKKLLFTSCLLTTLALSAFAEEIPEDNSYGENRDLFSLSQRQVILETIDKTCGDSWCEGDYDFSFKNFSCSNKTFVCELSFQFIKRDEETNAGTFSKMQYCHFKNIHDFNQIMENEYALNSYFYESLTECITKKENTIDFSDFL